MHLQQVTSEIADAIEILWREDAIRLIYDLRATTKIHESSAHFWDDIRRISKPDYMPTDEDILLVKWRRTRVEEHKFQSKDIIFHIFTKGGYETKREKWLHCFQSVRAVVFVSVLSDYDEHMFEGMYSLYVLKRID